MAKAKQERTKITYRLQSELINDIDKLAEELKITSNAMANIIVEEGIKVVKERK